MGKDAQVCVYACIYSYACVCVKATGVGACVRTYTYTHTYTHTYIYTHTRTNIHMHTHIHTHAHIHAYTTDTHSHTHTHTHTRTHIAVLHLAARGGDTTLLEMLLDSSADPYVVDHDGRTALHAAAEQAQTSASRLLLMRDPSLSSLLSIYYENPIHSLLISVAKGLVSKR